MSLRDTIALGFSVYLTRDTEEGIVEAHVPLQDFQLTQAQEDVLYGSLGDILDQLGEEYYPLPLTEALEILEEQALEDLDEEIFSSGGMN